MKYILNNLNNWGRLSDEEFDNLHETFIYTIREELN